MEADGKKITYRSGDILQKRVAHGLAAALSSVVPTGFLKDLEFELRYQRYIAEFGESDSDIYVSTYSKSGTTWTQLILYQLTTTGDMNFDHLFDVSPWVWYAALRKVKPAKTPLPRILKSHDDYLRFRKGRKGKFVFVMRDGRDVCVSLYHHRRNFKRYDGTFEQHFHDFLYGTEYNWFEHVRLWLENSRNLPIHYVFFEDLKNDFSGTVKGIADFCDIEVNDAVMARVLDRCSFASMKKHESQLGPRNSHFDNISDSPYHVKNADQFIRRGDVGEGKETLSPEQLAEYRKRFDETLSGFMSIAHYR